MNIIIRIGQGIRGLIIPLTHAGVNDAKHPEERGQIIMTNSMALIMISMVVGIGGYFFWIKNSALILIPAILEALSFCMVILMNHRHHFFAAGLAMLLINGIFAVYWTTVLGEGISIILAFGYLTLLLFHIIVSFFIIPEKRKKIEKPALIISLSTVMLLLLATTVNQHFHYIKPLSFNFNIIPTMRWVTTIAYSFLFFLIMISYIRRIQWLLQAEKKTNQILEAKGAFLRETYHELRTPLNSIFGIAQLFQLHNRTSDEDAENKSNLYAAAFLARDIINNVLDLSRIEAGKYNTVENEAFHLRHCVETYVSMNRYMAMPRRIQIVTVYENLPSYIITDKIVLSKIINNLLSNAVKFSTLNSCIEIYVSREEDQISFRIKNRGLISKEKAAKAFDPFVAERNQYLEGTGLGLSITQHLVTLLDGTIRLDRNETEENTIFTFNIPLVAAPEQETTEKSAAARKGSFAGLKAVIIDDDPINRIVLKQMLVYMGVTVIPAESVPKGLTLIASSHPDLVVSDLHIGETGGKELLLQLRCTAAYMHLPVIIISGDAFKGTSELMLKLGANEFLGKPFLMEDLYYAMTRCLHPIRHISNSTDHYLTWPSHNNL